jgi:hypothetical protein
MSTGPIRSRRRRAVVVMVAAAVGVAALGIAQLQGRNNRDDSRVVAGEGDGPSTVPPTTDGASPDPDQTETPDPTAQPEGDATNLQVLSLEELDADVVVFDWDNARVTLRHDGQTRQVADLPDLEGSETYPRERVGHSDTQGGVVYQTSPRDGQGIWHVAAGTATPTLVVPAPEEPSERLQLAGTANLNGIPYAIYATGRASGLLEDEGEQLIRSALDGSHTETHLDDTGNAWEGGVRAARIADGWTALWRLDSVLDRIWRFIPGVDFATDPAFGSAPILESADGDPVRLVDFDMVTAREADLLTVMLTTSGPDEQFGHAAALLVDLGIGEGTSSEHIEVPSGGADVYAYAVSTDGSLIVVSRRSNDGPVQPLFYDLQTATWSRLDVAGVVRLVPPETTVAS